MEKLKDLLNSLKDRFSNPLVFSFICSWLVLNWPVTIAVLWHDTAEIEKSGYKTIFNFIWGNTTPNQSFWNPLGLAIAFTISMPTINNLVRALYSFTAKWGENWNLKILKGGKVPIEKYFKFREEYNNRTKILEEIISQENELTGQVEKSRTEFLKSQTLLNELRKDNIEKNDFINQLTDVKLLNGHWTNKYAHRTNAALKGKEEIIIEDGKYYVLEDFGIKKHYFNISNFVFDSRLRTIFFMKERITQEEPFVQVGNAFNLRYNPNIIRIENNDLLVGIENGITEIEYSRKPLHISMIEDRNDSDPTLDSN